MAGKPPRYWVTEFERHASQSIQGLSTATLRMGERFTFAGKFLSISLILIKFD
jgi:hypothetical protein